MLTKANKLFLLLFAVLMVQIKDPLYAGADTYEPIWVEPVTDTQEETIKPDIEYTVIENTEDKNHGFTDEEIYMLAQTVMNEASYLEFDAKVGIAQTIINRLESDFKDFRKDTTIYEVIYHKNAYSTANKWEPTEECFEAVYWMLEYRPFPADMFWFCYGFQPAYGYEYCSIDNNYFTTLSDYNKEVASGSNESN